MSKLLSTSSARSSCLALALTLLVSGCGDKGGEDSVTVTPVEPSAPAVVAPRAAPAVVPDGDTIDVPVSTEGNEPLVLGAGQTAHGEFPSPRGGKIAAMSIQVGTYLNTSTGMLKLKVCSGDICATGDADLLTSLDNTDFVIGLESPLEASEGTILKYELTKEGGDVPVAIWTYPAVAGGAQAVSIAPDQVIEGRSPKVALTFLR